ncbi:MAG TPA: phytanoyl-CoA dioxygenase family protein [Capsulimonadaceae bacterium]
MNSSNNLSDIAARFEADGFVVLEGFFSGIEVTAMNNEIEKHYAPILAKQDEAVNQKGDAFRQFNTEVIPWDPCGEGNAVFAAVRDDSRLRDATAACIQPDFNASGSLVMLSVGGGKGQAWHQDCPAVDSTQFNLNRLIYTQDIAAESGAIVLVPGSHRAGAIPPGGSQDPLPGEVMLTPKAGTLVLMNGHVYHRVTPNTTSNPRLSVNFRAYGKGVSPDVCNIGVFRNGAFDFAKNAVTTDPARR